MSSFNDFLRSRFILPPNPALATMIGPYRFGPPMGLAFAESLMSGQYSGVYVVEGWAGLYGEWQVLYVGQSADIGDRLRNHLEQKRKWFGFVGLPLYATDVDIDSRLRVRYCLALTQTDLDTIEGFVSRLLRPIYGERSPQFWIEG